jgi:hypothetical protein
VLLLAQAEDLATGDMNPFWPQGRLPVRIAVLAWSSG